MGGVVDRMALWSFPQPPEPLIRTFRTRSLRLEFGCPQCVLLGAPSNVRRSAASQT
jgi:hypothetical protein